MRYESKTVLQIILDRAGDKALDALLMNPDLQFLYPVKGLEWVIYAGKGLCNRVLDPGTLIPFDPYKIKDIKYVTKKSEPDLIIDDNTTNTADIKPVIKPVSAKPLRVKL